MSWGSWNFSRERFVLTCKVGSVFLLFLVSVLIAACGASNTTIVPGSPPVTLTVNLNRSFASPTPTLPPYFCAAWATQSSPAYYPGAVVEVYAKYVQNVNGNPRGMNLAHAVATVLWPASAPTTINVTTTSDGLAVFQVPLQPDAVGHQTLVAVSFTSQDGQHTCNVTGTRDAFFMATIVTPTATPSPSPSPSPSPGG